MTGIKKGPEDWESFEACNSARLIILTLRVTVLGLRPIPYT